MLRLLRPFSATSAGAVAAACALALFSTRTRVAAAAPAPKSQRARSEDGDATAPVRKEFEALVLRLQDEICASLTALEDRAEAAERAEAAARGGACMSSSSCSCSRSACGCAKMSLAPLVTTKGLPPVPTLDTGTQGWAAVEAFLGDMPLRRSRVGAFVEDAWARPEAGGGGGRTRVLQGGRVFEKAGVNVSVVRGTLPAAAVAQMRARPGKAGGPGGAVLSGDGPFTFYAAGISLVVHPANPHAPTAHANYRYFEVRAPGVAEPLWWYGGGADLTPAVLYEDDARHFHTTLRTACDAHDGRYYPAFKAWADEYFRLPHRGGERRGLGGIFFDDLDDSGAVPTATGVLPPSQPLAAAAKAPERAAAAGPAALLPFVRAAGEAFVPAYVPIVARRAAIPATPAQVAWQQLRRGRYVEFNLLQDRGTKFGLATPHARIESILMSLPLTARWEYGHEPEAGSADATLVDALRSPRDWA